MSAQPKNDGRAVTAGGDDGFDVVHRALRREVGDSVSEIAPDNALVAVQSIADQPVSAHAREIEHQAAQAISARLGTTTDVALAMLCGLARSQERDLGEYADEVIARGGRLG